MGLVIGKDSEGIWKGGVGMRERMLTPGVGFGMYILAPVLT
jgi:hypothetical protein